MVGIPWSLPAFAAGLRRSSWRSSGSTARYRHVSPTLRRVVEFSQTALTASLVAGVLVVANVVAFRYGGRAIDLTRDRAFSLSSLTINQLRSLDRPVAFTVFFGNSERSARQLDRVRQMLELYRAANPSRVRVEYLDPYLDIKEFEELVKRVPGMVAVARRRDRGGLRRRGRTPAHVVIGTRELFEGQGSRFERGARPVRLDLPGRGRGDLGPDPAPRGEAVAGSPSRPATARPRPPRSTPPGRGSASGGPGWPPPGSTRSR